MPPYRPTVFHVEHYVVLVNALLFASLCCSLVAALAAVLALQWVNEYDARIDTMDSEKRAIIRHLRYIGAGRWKMAEIIAVLPLLLHGAVFLFFAGIMSWLWNIHHVISWICVAGDATAGLFYAVTALLSASFSASPFRSPMARAVRYVQYMAAWHITNALYQTIRWTGSHSYTSISRPVLYFIDNKRVEERHATNSTNKLNTLIWTVDHVEMTSKSTRRCLWILKDFLPLYVETATRDYPDANIRMSFLWERTIRHVSQSYLDKVAFADFSVADLEAIRLLVSSWTLDYFNHMRSLVYHFGTTRSAWDLWQPIGQLLGPLPPCGTLQAVQLDFVIAVIKSMWLRNSEKAVKKLIATIKKAGTPANSQEEQILSYSIDCLSILLFTRGSGHDDRQAAGFLTETVTVPPGQVCAGVKGRGTIGHYLSAIYSLAFNSSSRHTRSHWASKHHLCLASDLGKNSEVLKALHVAITSRVASDAAICRDIFSIRTYIQVLCRLLAYTPFSRHGDRNSTRASDIIKEIPNSLHLPSEVGEPTPPALTSLVWLQKLKEIPRIHEYLEVFLICRRRFPDLVPVWRDWISYTQKAWKHNGASPEDQQWLDQRKQDRRIIEVFVAFDQLVSHGCSTAQHLVLVQLLTDDLLHDSVAGDENYYSEARKAVLRGLKDPALRLVGARAANIPYTGFLPPLEADGWLSEPWIEAFEYWCGQYNDVDAATDEALLVTILSQPSSGVYSALLEASSRNTTLQVSLLRQSLPFLINTHSIEQAPPCFGGKVERAQ
jgi:Family of unknown function (DUF6535)